MPSAARAEVLGPKDVAEVARTRLQAARAKAISLVPYFGAALSSMVMHEVPHLGTVATDTRWRFYYDPEVVAGWSLGTCVAAWVHEVKHNLHGHAERFRALGAPADQHPVFNIAGDALINEDLLDLERIVRDRSALELSPRWVYLENLPVAADRTMTAEQIFHLLTQQDSPMPAALDCGSGAGAPGKWWELPQDDGRDGSLDPGRGDLISFETARQVAAHLRQYGRGSVPGGTQRWAEAILEPAVDWRTELRSVVSHTCAAVRGRRDYTFARPSRRRAPQGGVVLPGLVEPPPPQGAVVLDTSASMSSDDLAQGVAEVAGILKQVSRGRAPLSVIACDHAADNAQKIRAAADVRLVGGGGTDLRYGIDAAAELRPRADFVVIFTDGDTPWPVRPPERNPAARYVAVLCDGPRRGVPEWMRTIVVDRS